MPERTSNIAWKKGLSPRFFIAMLLGCFVAVLAFSQAAASVGLPIETFRPLGAGFFSTRIVQAEVSRQLVGEQPPADTLEVATVGKAGLELAPLNTRALWLIGQSYDLRGLTANARAAMRQAERVSRRDPAVQLWLGSDNLKNQKVEPGLRNFDLMIRTNSAAADVVTPELAKLIVHPDARRHLAPYFRETNPWFLNLIWAAASKLPDGEPLAQLLIEQKQMAPDIEGVRPIYTYLLKKLAAEGSYATAMQLYPKLPGMNPANLSSLDPMEDGQLAEGYPPFTWDFAEGGARGGDIVSIGDGRAGVEVYGMPGTVGVAASKLVAPKGRSTFQWRIIERTTNTQGRVKWIATCLMGPATGSKVESINFAADDYPLAQPMTMALPMASRCDLLRFDLQVTGGIGRNAARAIVADAAVIDRSTSR